MALPNYPTRTNSGFIWFNTGSTTSTADNLDHYHASFPDSSDTDAIVSVADIIIHEPDVNDIFPPYDVVARRVRDVKIDLKPIMDRADAIEL